MRERTIIMFLFCGLLAAFVSAEEVTEPIEPPAQVSGLPVSFSELLPLIGGAEPVPVAAGGVQNASCTATCADGSTVSCPRGTSSCSKADSNCGGTPSHRGYVTCGPFTIWCEPLCPCEGCPDTPGCNYQYHTATGCCIDSEDPVSCPDICE